MSRNPDIKLIPNISNIRRILLVISGKGWMFIVFFFNNYKCAPVHIEGNI